MPKAGIYDYPSRDLDDCLSYLRRAREPSESRTMTRGAFARAIGQSPGGGGFGKLVGAMSAYGLIETGGGRITVTDLGEQVLWGVPAEQRRARERSVRRVRLFDEIIQKFGGQPTDEQLRVFLRASGGVDLVAAKNLAADVGKLLRRNAVHVSAGSSVRSRSDGAEGPVWLGGLVGRLEMADYGILNIRDEISMDMVINLLNEVKKRKGWGVSVRRGGPPESRTQPETSAPGAQAEIKGEGEAEAEARPGRAPSGRKTGTQAGG